MRKSSFTEAQIIGVFKEQGLRIDRRLADLRAVLEAWAESRDVLQAEGQVWRDGPVRRQAAEAALGREATS